MKPIQNKLKCFNCEKTFYSSGTPHLCPKCKQKVVNDQIVVDDKKLKKEIQSPPLPYKFGIVKLTKSLLPRFAFLSNRRRIIESNANSLFKVLKDGGHFESPIVVSEEDRIFYVIDGNHRIEAFKKMISRQPSYELETLLITYGRLTDDEKISVYRRWNVGRSQSTDDFIQSVSQKIPLLRWFRDGFPIQITIYKISNSIHVRSLCNAYVAAKKGSLLGHGFTRKDVVEELMKLDNEDYNFLIKFAKNYSEVVGIPSYNNPYYRTSLINSVVLLAFEYENAPFYYKALQERVVGNEQILKFSKMGGREASRQMTQILRDKIKLKPILSFKK